MDNKTLIIYLLNSITIGYNRYQLVLSDHRSPKSITYQRLFDHVYIKLCDRGEVSSVPVRPH